MTSAPAVRAVADREDFDGRPIPASQPMSREAAEWYAAYTDGQLVPFLHENGDWYLYAPNPAPVRQSRTQ
jgi:hypothetical protein